MEKFLILITLCLICIIARLQDRLQNETEGFSFEVNDASFFMDVIIYGSMNVKKDSKVIRQKNIQRH